MRRHLCSAFVGGQPAHNHRLRRPFHLSQSLCAWIPTTYDSAAITSLRRPGLRNAKTNWLLCVHDSTETQGHSAQLRKADPSTWSTLLPTAHTLVHHVHAGSCPNSRPSSRQQGKLANGAHSKGNVALLRCIHGHFDAGFSRAWQS